MYMAHPGHVDHIKQVNAGRVYQLIDQYGPISRIDLSKLSDLAPASITKITRELIAAHLVHETTVQEALSRGRPAVGLQTRNEGWQFLSIRLGRGYMTLALHELGGDVLIDSKIEIHETDQDDLLARILHEINDFFQTYSSHLERLTSIAITLPGSVNGENGVVMKMPFYQVKDFPLGVEIYKATGVPVFIANDTRAWALAEKLFGHAQNSDNSVLVSIHNGLSAGVMVSGRVLQGRFGNIGDMGHIQVDPMGKTCSCGKKGCFDTVASSQAIRDEVKSRILSGEKSILSDSVNYLTLEDICHAAVLGDALSCDVMRRLGTNLGKAISILINMFHPDKVLIAGVINQTKEVLYPSMLQCISDLCQEEDVKSLDIMASRFYKQSTMPGAALIKQALFDGSLLMKVTEG